MDNNAVGGASIVVVDPFPMLRRGMAAALQEAGHRVEDPTDVREWASRRGTRLLVLTVIAEADWALLDQLSKAEAAPVIVAVVDDDDTVAGVQAVRAGARSVIPRNASMTVLQETVAATVRGQAVVPPAVIGELARGGEPCHDKPSAQELSWLQALADGSTVARVAEEARYSERSMYRVLGVLYGRMGVKTRLEAVMRARQMGWI